MVNLSEHRGVKISARYSLWCDVKSAFWECAGICVCHHPNVACIWPHNTNITTAGDLKKVELLNRLISTKPSTIINIPKTRSVSYREIIISLLGADAFESAGRPFESGRARHLFNPNTDTKPL